MDRGHIWTSKRFLESAQRVAILAASPKAVLYIDDIDAAIKSLRTGTKLFVYGFRGLGRSDAEIRKNLKRVHAKKAVVVDASTGRLSTSKHCELMIVEALRALTNERRGPQKRTKKDRRMPWDMVAIYYFDPRLSNDELEAAVANGYSPMTYHTMRRHFKKKRGAPVGRPSVERKRLR